MSSKSQSFSLQTLHEQAWLHAGTRAQYSLASSTMASVTKSPPLGALGSGAKLRMLRSERTNETPRYHCKGEGSRGGLGDGGGRGKREMVASHTISPCLIPQQQPQHRGSPPIVPVVPERRPSTVKENRPSIVVIALTR